MTGSLPVLSAFTLTQPWATLSVAPIIRGEYKRPPVLAKRPPKIHETRGYQMNLSGGPRRIAIHAGKGDAQMRTWLVGKEDSWSTIGVLVEPYRSALRACGYSASDPWGTKHTATDNALYRLPLGAIVGLVTVTRCVRTVNSPTMLAGDETDELDMDLGNWEPGRYAWRMEDAFLLPEPVQCRGFQSLWRPDEATQKRVWDLGGRW